ncbi:pentatricopeptide repeat-containing protein At1g64583, mitochondrial-like [Daucus carota subsp. sativus]|uniref:pentatricopeptide repeat-containing protein At1g64583, mitochondrial-like n=1 Tax=Daucus carota subsp. sativus TaxID=79200 RepID=UPI003082DC67
MKDDEAHALEAFRPHIPYSSNPTHARLGRLLLEKAKVGFCYLNRVDFAFSLLAGIIRHGFVPNVVTYTTLIRGLISQDMPHEAQLLSVDQALGLFYQMNKKGISPDVITYNSLIQGLCDLMNKTYTMMIQAYCHEGLFQEANELFWEMEANDCLPDNVTYNTLMRGYLHNKKYYEAGVLLDEMRSRGFEVDASTASALLDLLEVQEQDPALLALRKKYLP